MATMDLFLHQFISDVQAHKQIVMIALRTQWNVIETLIDNLI